MSTEPFSQQKSVHQHAFDHYLRTGERLTNAEWQTKFEHKFNPYHDDIGRFTSATGESASNSRTTPRMAERNRTENRPDKPISGQSIPPGGRVIAEAGVRAASFAAEIAEKSRHIALSYHPPVRELLQQIARGEGVGDEGARLYGFDSSYDVPFNYGRFARQDKPLTRMTLGEIDELQSRILDNPENRHRASPVGKYQLVQRTLRGLKAELGLTDSMIFNQTLQDRLGTKLLEKRGLSDYIDGKISESEFQRRIANEWASVATPKTGRSRYGQPLGTTTTQIMPLIRALRKK